MWNRFNSALRSQLNHLLDRAARGDDLSASIAAIDEAIRAGAEAIDSAKTHIASVDRAHARAQALADEAEKRAMAALRAGDEAEARRHLAASLEALRERDELAPSLAAERAEIESIAATLKEFRERREALRGAGDRPRADAPPDGAVDDALADRKKKLDDG